MKSLKLIHNKEEYSIILKPGSIISRKGNRINIYLGVEHSLIQVDFKNEEAAKIAIDNIDYILSIDIASAIILEDIIGIFFPFLSYF